MNDGNQYVGESDVLDVNNPACFLKQILISNFSFLISESFTLSVECNLSQDKFCMSACMHQAFKMAVTGPLKKCKFV